MTEAIDALNRLVAPLPAEVAETIEWLNMGTTLAADGSPSLYRKTARLLESQARENARLVNNHHVQNRANAVLAKERDRLAAENAELRATLNAERENRSDNGDPMLIDRLRAELASYKLDVKKGGA